MLKLVSHLIILVLVEYLDYDDKVEMICCCEEWYESWMRGFIRRLRIHTEQLRETTSKQLFARVNASIMNPFDQLKLSVNKFIALNDLISFLSLKSFSFNELECSESHFLEIVSSVGELRVKHLTIDLRSPNSDHSFLLNDEIFFRILDCDSLSIICSRNSPLINVNIVHLPSLKKLAIKHISTSSIEQSLGEYARSLHFLSLHYCTITDVTMLGSIPHLEIKCVRT